MASPSFGFLVSHPAHLLACGLGSGLSPWAPGTAGTLLAWALYPLLRPQFSELGFAVFLACGFLIGIAACQRTGTDLGVIDHGAIVWDEMVPFWTVLLVAPQTWTWQLVAFALFRGFDILKPPPAAWIDRGLKNGFGVMLDDVIAAAYTLFALALLRHMFE